MEAVVGMKDSDTLTLMRIIGLPDTNTKTPQEDLSEDSLLSLLPLAVKNRVSLLFLENAADICCDSKSLKMLRQVYRKKSRLALSLVREASGVLVERDMNCVVFKTLKPFPFTTVDVDILFFNREDLTRAYYALRNNGCKLAGCGAHSISLYSPKHAMNVDLQLEISVSRLVYIDKNLLREYVTEINVNGSQVRVLEPPAALVTVLAHSLYKEQIFTLSDYYTSMIQLLNMTNQQRRTFVDLAEQARIEPSIKSALILINTLTTMVFGRTIPVITETTQLIQSGEIEDKMMQLALSHFAQNARLPYKYHPISLVAAFAMKTLRDPVMRGTVAQQFVEMITDTSKFLESMLLHMRRETY